MLVRTKLMKKIKNNDSFDTIYYKFYTVCQYHKSEPYITINTDNFHVKIT